MTWCKSSSRSGDPSTLDRVVTGSNPGRALKGTSPPPFLFAKQSTKGEKNSLSLIQISPSHRSSRRRPPLSPVTIPARRHHHRKVPVVLCTFLRLVSPKTDPMATKTASTARLRRRRPPVSFSTSQSPQSDLHHSPSDRNENEICCSPRRYASTDRWDSPSEAPIAGDAKADGIACCWQTAGGRDHGWWLGVFKSGPLGTRRSNKLII
ncbi:hypothetical protein GQ457_07G013800 [Hibiscus cannabinus]